MRIMAAERRSQAAPKCEQPQIAEVVRIALRAVVGKPAASHEDAGDAQYQDEEHRQPVQGAQLPVPDRNVAEVAGLLAAPAPLAGGPERDVAQEAPLLAPVRQDRPLATASAR